MKKIQHNIGEREIKVRVWVQDDKYVEDGMYFIDLKGEVSEFDCRIMQEHVVMQYTGLKDKNGKEIWEGDILKFVSMSRIDLACGDEAKERIEIIRYNEEECSLWVGGEDGFKPDMGADDNEFEIIDNVFENPKLLTN